jgi:aminobutyraldehyde dehydrogenase
MQTRLLIDGKLTGGEGVAESILDPATGAEIAKVPEASREQVDAAVRAAKAAFSGWSQTTPKDRAALLLKLADRIEGDAAALAELESRNAGKPLAAALNDEIPAIADVFRFFAGAARTQHGALAGEYLPGFTSMIRRDPVGVVASIAPWNYPLMMEVGPRSRRRQHGYSEAVGTDTADSAEARGVSPRAVSERGGEHHLRAG